MVALYFIYGRHTCSQSIMY